MFHLDKVINLLLFSCCLITELLKFHFKLYFIVFPTLLNSPVCNLFIFFEKIEFSVFVLKENKSFSELLQQQYKMQFKIQEFDVVFMFNVQLFCD